MAENKANKSPYSYHTFCFPFIWEGADEKPKEQTEIVELIQKLDCWEEENIEKIKRGEEMKYLYQTMQYFHAPVRNAILKSENKVVYSYRFCPDRVHNKALYCINKGEKKYELKIYNTGVGIIIFECENIREDQRNIKTVKDINEYGRRVTTPFLPSSENGKQLCADTIEIKIEGIREGEFKTEFKNIFAYKNVSGKKEIPFTYIADFILKILSGGSNKVVKFVSDKKEIKKNKKYWFIYPALDDRMYVTCIVKDCKYSDKIKKAIENSNENKDALKSLYELAYIDKEGKISCPTYRMMYEILNKQVYDRWLEDGTAYIVTHHSFLCVTGEGEEVEDPVVIPFLIQYIEMVLICLAQRSSIILFQKRAALFTKDMAGHQGKLRGKNIKKLIDLQESYIAFQNQLMFFEVTSQEQGIELYDMISDSLYIKKEREMLEGQINIAYEAVNVYQGNILNSRALIISLIALLMAIAGSINDCGSLIGNLFGEQQCKYICISAGKIFVIIIIILIGRILLYRRNR